MGLFRLDEVLQMAMRAEQMGQRLYEAVAHETKDKAVADLCRRLAAQEKAHFHTFQTMSEALPQNYDAKQLSLDEMAFVQSLVEGTVIPTEAEVRKMARSASLAEMLDRAIAAERDSQHFYRQIAQGVDAAGAKTVNAIIAEEAEHEKTLTAMRKKL